MIIADIMTREVEWVPPDATLQEAAQLMDSRNIGLLFVTRDFYLATIPI